MNAFYRLLNRDRQTLETHRYVDKIAQDKLRGLGFTVKKKHNCLNQCPMQRHQSEKIIFKHLKKLISKLVLSIFVN